jgi:geranylgeranyl pyrophosphate synthase
LCENGRVTSPLSPKVLSGAVSVELTHTTTLLHDDVVDSAEVRRGKPAANLIWGNGMSVLVGDYLFAQVFLIASQKGYIDLMHPLAEATSQMCAGELLEVQKRGSLDMSEQDYQEIVALKTASLTECSCRIGAIAVNASDEAAARLARFGHLIGLAFQIVDDIFDITSSRGRIGKPVGNDIREGVITLPMLRAMQLCDEEDKATLTELIGKSPIEDDEVERVLHVLRCCGAPESAMNTALEHVQTAKCELEHFAPCAARDMLCDIADYVVSRDK